MFFEKRSDTETSELFGGAFSGENEQSEVVGTTFNDTNGHWAEQTINELQKMGIVNGDGDGNFRPNDPATRAEVAAIARNVVRFITGK